MRRNDREIHDLEQIRRILADSRVCHLAMVDDGRPYLIPLNFAFTLDSDALTLYFHSAPSGRKLDILRKNADVCFEISREGGVEYAENPCATGFCYESVIGFGQAEFVEVAAEKCRALTLLMRCQTGRDIPFTPAQAAPVCIFRVTARDYTGKAKPRPAAP